jgi:hypothetical protein
VLAVTVLAPGGAAQAEATTTITVTPNTGLIDGQTVTVSGTGFPQNFTRVLQCGPALGSEPDLHAAVTLCALAPFIEATVDAQGNVQPIAMPVTETIATDVGPVDCVASHCVILIGSLGGPDGFLTAVAPIRFGMATPATKAECKRGGWRNLANDQGRPFRNQGQCVRFVVTDRR